MDNFIPFFQLVIIFCALISAVLLAILGIVAILRYYLDVPLITKERIEKEWSFEGVPTRIKDQMYRHEGPAPNPGIVNPPKKEERQ